MRTDGQTDVTKLIAAFRDFLNAPKNFRLPGSFFFFLFSPSNGAHLKNVSIPQFCGNVECKGKVTPLQAQFWPRGGRGIALLSQDLGARRG